MKRVSCPMFAVWLIQKFNSHNEPSRSYNRYNTGETKIILNFFSFFFYAHTYTYTLPLSAWLLTYPNCKHEIYSLIIIIIIYNYKHGWNTKTICLYTFCIFGKIYHTLIIKFMFWKSFISSYFEQWDNIFTVCIRIHYNTIISNMNIF